MELAKSMDVSLNPKKMFFEGAVLLVVVTNDWLLARLLLPKSFRSRLGRACVAFYTFSSLRSDCVLSLSCTLWYSSAGSSISISEMVRTCEHLPGDFCDFIELLRRDWLCGF